MARLARVVMLLLLLVGRAAASDAQAVKNQHKDLQPVASSDFVFMAIAAIILMLSAGAGIGGGVLLVPLLSLVTGFDSRDTVFLSNITILAASIANAAFNLPRKNPDRPGPIISYELLLLLGCPTVLGAVLGAFLNTLVPGWVCKLLVLAILVPMTWRMARKAAMLVRLENRARAMLAEQHAQQQAAAKAAALEAPAERLPSIREAAGSGREPDWCSGLAPSPFAAGVPASVQGRAQSFSAAGAAAAPSRLQRACSARLSLVGAGRSFSRRLSDARSLAETFGPDLMLVAHGGEAAQAQLVQALSCSLSSCQSSRRGVHVRIETSPTERGAGPGRQPGRQQQQQGDGNGDGDGDGAGALPAAAASRCSAREHFRCCHSEALDARMAARFRAQDAAQLPWRHLCLLAAMLAVVVASRVGVSLTPCGSAGHFALAVAPLPLMLVFWAWLRHWVLARSGWRRHLCLLWPNDLLWTRRNTVWAPGISIAAGLMAGLLGLGGGTVLTPLLLELHVPPAVAMATSQSAILVSSASSSIVYALGGARGLPWDYAACFALLGFVATAFGQIAISLAVARLGQPSLLVVVLCALFVAAAGCATSVVVLALIGLAHEPGLLGAVHGLCPDAS